MKKPKPLDLWEVLHKLSKKHYVIGMCECCGCWNVFRIEANDTLTFLGEYPTDKEMEDAIDQDAASLN